MKTNRWTRYKDMKISAKLGIGFGVFVVLAFISAFISYLGSRAATQKIDLTSSVRMPVALTASRAQIDLLRMISDVRGYLVLGDREYWDSYLQSERTFRADLDALEQLTPDFDSINAGRFDQLKQAYTQWSALPTQLYKLRNDQLDREPAYRLLATDGVRLAGQVLIKMNNLIDAPRVASAQSVSYLQSMARFQGSFAAMLSALRGYTTTRNRIYRQEFDVNLAANNITWDEIWSKHDSLPEDQQKLLDQARENRQAFLALPDQIFVILEGDRWREDLYLFRTSAVPITDKMNSLLTDMTTDQGTQLTTELDEGRQALITANFEILGGGLVAVLIALLLAFASRANIAEPIRRLTGVAEQIQGGDLGAQAHVESLDEIGILGRTFNSMTAWLRETLTQVRKEKNRADNLLTVVIPLGVQLSSEKNFDLLLERILLGAKSFCHAGGGLLYLRTTGGMLKPVVVRFDGQESAPDKPVERPTIPLNDPGGDARKHPVAVQVTLDGQSLNQNFEGSNSQASQFDLGLEIQESGGVVPTSVLAIPLKNSTGEVLGVLELLDAKDAETDQYVPFDANLQQLMESFSSLAAAALEGYVREQGLRHVIQQLRIEIDEAKQHQQINEIIDTDFFQGLQTRARAMRKNRGQNSSQSE